MASTSQPPTSAESEQGSSDEHKVALVLRILLGELTAERACAEEHLTSEELTEWMRLHRRAARRVIDDRFAAALSAQGLDSDDFVMSGNLESMVLSDLLEAIRLGRKNAHIRIEHAGEYSHLWCADGEVIDAQAGLLVGDAAVYRLLALGQGRLQADFARVARERTVLASTESLLVDFARRLDEGRLLRERIGDTERVCVPDPRPHVAQAGLDPEERSVLQAFDGTRSIEAVIQASQRPELETLDAIFRLLSERRLIPAAELGSAPASVRAPTVELRSLSPSDPRRASQLSVPPIAPSTAAQPAKARGLGFTPLTATLAAALGAVLPLVFAAGLWSARPSRQSAAAVPSPPSLKGLVDSLCGPGMALFAAGGPLAAGAPEASLRSFCLAQRPVSTSDYEACVTSQRCEPAHAEPDSAEGLGRSPSLRCNSGQPGREAQPINCVTHAQAEQYCAWRGQRLPSPGEWESAWQMSRGGAGWLRGTEAQGGTERGPSLLGELSEWTKGHVARTPPGVEPSAEQQLYAVLGAGSGSAARGESARPSRLYMSASAHGRNVGFRCALSLEASATPPRVEPSVVSEVSERPPPAPGQ